MMKLSWTATASTALIAALSLEMVALAGLQGWVHPRAVAPPAQTQQAALPVSAPMPLVQPQPQPEPARSYRVANQDHYYYDQLRGQIRWVETRFGGENRVTPDAHSRVLLAKSAAERAGLHEVGLSFTDVYGIINAETSWIPRMGASKNGTPNLGIAQFEPATARALGVRNPNDPVEAIHAAAVHMKDAAEWSANRIARLKLAEEEHAVKLREGVSIFYNLSTRGRNRWDGRNTNVLPVETRQHIRNARTGAQRAAELESILQVSTGFLQTGG